METGYPTSNLLIRIEVNFSTRERYLQYRETLVDEATDLIIFGGLRCWSLALLERLSTHKLQSRALVPDLTLARPGFQQRLPAEFYQSFERLEVRDQESAIERSDNLTYSHRRPCGTA